MHFEVIWLYILNGQPADGLYETDDLDSAISFMNDLAIDPDIQELKLIKRR